MKSYSLFLHWKQGDDLAEHVDKTETLSSALRSWGGDFERRRVACEKIATALDGKKIDVFAGTHVIDLSPRTKKAREACEQLVLDGFLSVNDGEDS